MLKLLLYVLLRCVLTSLSINDHNKWFYNAPESREKKLSAERHISADDVRRQALRQGLPCHVYTSVDRGVR
jgi:hypothetical protein